LLIKEQVLDSNSGSLSDWLTYLEQLHPSTIDMGLERVEQVRSSLKLVPNFPVITVGGTNGKGSVCAILESILVEAGYTVGCYTSPHLVHYNERIRINKKPLEDQRIVEAFVHIEQIRNQCEVTLTYFEFGTLAAMFLFVSQSVDVVILEVGLGGRLDAVNVFVPDCAVLTNIEMDHMDYLGDSREAIGYEKAGIFRPGKPAICADTSIPTTVNQYAKQINAKLIKLDYDFGYSTQTDCWHFWSMQGKRNALPKPALLGDVQLKNASTALAVLDVLHDRLPVDMQSIRTGLLNVSLLGRFQVLSLQPMIVLDVAHNPAAAKIVAVNLKLMQPMNFTGKTYIVFAMLQDKDISGVIEALKEEVDIWLLAPIKTSRGTHTQTLLESLYKLKITRENHSIHEFENTESAFVFACEQATKNDRICVLGSFHTVNAVLQYWDRKNSQ